MITPSITQSRSVYPELLHYRRSVSDLYAYVRQSEPGAATWTEWRKRRDALFAHHSQSALTADQLIDFEGLHYFEYDPAYRFEAEILTDVEHEIIPIETEVDGVVRAKRFGRVELDVKGTPVSLSLYWLLGYGGGVFLPFKDLTAPDETYGGGRYLLDTIKHADLGQTPDGKIILDFNYSYNPSCAYNHNWSCPLAPIENHLPVSIAAGEKRFH